MKTKLNQPLLIGLGALWGMIEATLGWGIHLLHLPFRSLILFPIGLFFMLYGVRRTGKAQAALLVALVAAFIKLINLLMPGFFPVYYVVNPAIAIGLEGAAVTVFAHFYMTNPRKTGVCAVGGSVMLAISLMILMQIVFTGWQLIISGLTVENPALIGEIPIGNLLPFLVRNLLKGGLLAGMVRLLRPFPVIPKLRFHWAWSLSLVVVAIIVNYFTL